MLAPSVASVTSAPLASRRVSSTYVGVFSTAPANPGPVTVALCGSTGSPVTCARHGQQTERPSARATHPKKPADLSPARMRLALSRL
eukprot:233077-Pyramimonas_sp.AAC.1